MNEAMLLNASEWAIETFGRVELGDPRRTDRAVQMASAMAVEPAASLPLQMGNASALQAAYRFLGNEAVSHAALQEPHWFHTRELAGQSQRVLLIQDTTDLNYSQHPKTSGLGPIGYGKRGQGFFLQTVVAVDPQTQEVLGLAYQEPFVRQPAPKGETRAQRRDRARESQVWQRAVQAIGAPPQPGQWVHVGDRYSDIFTFWQQCEQEQCAFVVRAAQDRRVQAGFPESGAEAEIQRLFDLTRALPPQGSRTKELPRLHERPARQAHLQISFQAITLLPPKNGAALRKTPVRAWVVRVWEPELAACAEPLEWVLVTSVPVETLAAAWQCVDWYTMRWIIEDFHQGLKTGCQIEQRHLDSYEDLTRLVGLLAPLALRLLQIRACARHAPDAPATTVLPVEIVQVVALLDQRPTASLSADELWRTIARLGGYLGRKSDGPPGWKTLWRGWSRVQQVLEGVHLATHFLSS